MTHTNLKSIICSFILFIYFNLSAHDIEVDSIYYNITSTIDKTIEITYKGDNYSSYLNEYAGNIIIPDTIIYNGNTYTVTSIGDYTFHNCINITSITIPNTIMTIGYKAFYGCSTLNNLIISDGVEPLYLDYNKYVPSNYGIGEPLFNNCQLEKIYIGRNLVYNIGSSFGFSPFYNQEQIKNVTISNFVSIINNDLFNNCTSLVSIIIPNSITEIKNSAFRGCTSLSQIIIPDKVKTLGSYIFYDCNYLKEIYIGDAVESLGNFAFYGCSNMEYCELGSAMQTIGTKAFSGCYNITKLISHAKHPPFCDSHALDDINKEICNLYIPQESITEYQTQEQWKDFFNVSVYVEKVNAYIRNIVEIARYDIYGRQLIEPTKGINIIKMSDGSTRKEYVK